MRLWSVCVAALLGATLASAPAEAQNNPFHVAGKWSLSATGERFSTGTYVIQQVQYTVVAKNSHGAQFHGQMTQPGTVEGDWRGANGKVGWITLLFTSDGRSVSGEYGYGEHDRPLGRIVGHRTGN